MIPFDGAFAQNIVYPLAFGAYDAEQPPLGYTYNITAFDILADLGKVQSRLKDLDKTDSKQRHRKPLDAMLRHSRKPRILSAPEATTAAVAAMVPNALPNNHFGWVCIDEANARLVVCFRGTEYSAAMPSSCSDLIFGSTNLPAILRRVKPSPSAVTGCGKANVHPCQYHLTLRLQQSVHIRDHEYGLRCFKSASLYR